MHASRNRKIGTNEQPPWAGVYRCAGYGNPTSRRPLSRRRAQGCFSVHNVADPRARVGQEPDVRVTALQRHAERANSQVPMVSAFRTAALHGSVAATRL